MCGSRSSFGVKVGRRLEGGEVHLKGAQGLSMSCRFGSMRDKVNNIEAQSEISFSVGEHKSYATLHIFELVVLGVPQTLGVLGGGAFSVSALDEYLENGRSYSVTEKLQNSR